MLAHLFRGATTKSGKTRVVPIGTTRLMAVLEWLRLDACGGRKPEETPVFSNEVGEATRTFKRAWTLTVLKAHGIAPRWRTGTYKDLAAESQQQLPGEPHGEAADGAAKTPGSSSDGRT